jgi:4-amino-4-deoxy-L-arabinose transferase-like glycosyltransferase
MITNSLPLTGLRFARFMTMRFAVAAWIATPGGGLSVLIATTLLLRLVFAGALGLGIDESYMAASSRSLQLSYFDHPPIAWWLTWLAANLAGTDTALVVRLPFILLFALSTWLMFSLVAILFGKRPAFYAAVLLNIVPVLGVTSASWVLPDGPLIAALLGSVLCFIHAIRTRGGAAWAWWIALGACAGLALTSKYTAILIDTGLVAYLVTSPLYGYWLRTSPWPWRS